MILPIIAANMGITRVTQAYTGYLYADFGWSKHTIGSTDVTVANSEFTTGQGVLGFIFLGVIILNFLIGLYLNFLLFQRNMEKNQDITVGTCQRMGMLVVVLQIAITVIFQQAIIAGIVTNYGSGSYNLPLGWGGGVSHGGAVLMFVGMLVLGGAQGACWTVGQNPPNRNMQMMMANGQQVPTIQSSGAATSQQVGMVYAQPVGTQQVAYGQPVAGQQVMASGGGGTG
jgi:hypothetical protein